MSDLAERLKAIAAAMGSFGSIEREAATRIEQLEAENARLRESLAWYGENARLARLITSEGDPGRYNLANDGGNRARAALAGKAVSHD